MALLCLYNSAPGGLLYGMLSRYICSCAQSAPLGPVLMNIDRLIEQDEPFGAYHSHIQEKLQLTHINHFKFLAEIFLNIIPISAMNESVLNVPDALGIVEQYMLRKEILPVAQKEPLAGDLL